MSSARPGLRSLRFNKRFEGGVRILEVPKVKRTQHPDGDDISIAPLEISPTTFRTLCIEPERFVTETILKEEDIGIGDDVFMVGRFIHHSGGSAQNIPSVRFGNIAMMNRQRIARDDGLLQETFLVESRSVPRYSGSPVFVYKREFQEHKRVNPFQVQSQGFWLLGLDWCHLNDSVRVTEKPDNKEVLTPYSVRMNSGMAGVIPAWKILDVLDSEEFM